MAYRLLMPFASITVSTRGAPGSGIILSPSLRQKYLQGSALGIGGHSDEISEKGDDQFEISDERSVGQVFRDLQAHGLQPVMNDYVYV